MKPKAIMVVAGEASGDLLAAELVHALRQEMADAADPPEPACQPLHTTLEPRFFGAGGPRMAEAGVELALDMTAHAVTGLFEVLKDILKFRRFLHQLLALARTRQPDAIICVDFSGFNRRLAAAIKREVRSGRDWFHNWDPKLVQYVSPQVWGSREGRAPQLARDYDLLLSIFPFERDWYAQRTPELRVEFVGHPLLDRYGTIHSGAPSVPLKGSSPLVLLLPGSRSGELARHLPVMIPALAVMRAKLPGLRARMILPDEELLRQARNCAPSPEVEMQTGGLPESLAEATLAIASTGTVTMECAFFGVPTVTLYKTSWSTYQVARRMVKVKWLTMPNILAQEPLFPEFLQDAATLENLARAALELLGDESRRKNIQARLAQIISTLGGPGANRRAARAIVQLIS